MSPLCAAWAPSCGCAPAGGVDWCQSLCGVQGSRTQRLCRRGHSPLLLPSVCVLVSKDFLQTVGRLLPPCPVLPARLRHRFLLTRHEIAMKQA